MQPKSPSKAQHCYPLQQPLRLLMALAVGTAVIAVIWFASQGSLQTMWADLEHWQTPLPRWTAATEMVYNLWFWTVLLWLGVIAITKVSPQPQVWSRWLVVGILLVLTLRYLAWRIFSTLNLAAPLTGLLSMGLFGLEGLTLISALIQLTLLLRVRERTPEADLRSQSVLAGTYTPSVDILIPTYDEAPWILKRTLIGCQALDYPHKQIYVLDDTRRPQIQALAAELGCEYLTRADNHHAKAGNLNAAIPRTQGELVVVFDADFIPTRNFLSRTVGFFQDPQVALVQTPQTFYNPDPIAYNLGLDEILTPEEEVFYRQIQPFRDAADSVVCSGTSFVARRSALLEVGCFVTESLSEDYFTGIRLSAQGYRLVYLNEKLSAGLAPENMAAYAQQRIRWARGTLQAFFIQANPLTIPGLNPLQRLAHLEGLLHWFTSISRVGFLLVPVVYAALGVILIQATAVDILHYFVPYYSVQLVTFSWLNHRSRSALLSDLYGLVLCVPLALTVFQVLLNPFAQGFQVTPKGETRDRFTFNRVLAAPLLVLFGFNALSLWLNVGHYALQEMSAAAPLTSSLKGLGLGVFWSLYNLLMLSIALLILLDAPRPSAYEWFRLRRTVCLQAQGQTFWGFTTLLSEVGVEISLTQAAGSSLTEDQWVQITLMEAGLMLPGRVIDHSWPGDFAQVQLTFEPLSLDRQRELIALLFCRPGQWKSRCTPGELHSLGLLLGVLIKPRILFQRWLGSVRTITVAQH
nr:cellulose synthase catalytic subunit [Petrachloros mirabilis]